MPRKKPDPTLTGPQVLSWPAVGDIVVMEDGETYTVQNPCTDSRSGHWYCITHREHFDNQLQKDIHIHSGQHRLVWCCALHGLEISLAWAATWAAKEK